MLSKKNRLTKSGVARVLRLGKSIFQNSLFTVIYFSSHKNIQKEPQFAVVIGKRVAKTAVLRNYMRRTIYNAIQSNCDKFFPNGNIVFITKKEIVSRTKEDISAAVKDAVGVLKNLG